MTVKASIADQPAPALLSRQSPRLHRAAKATNLWLEMRVYLWYKLRRKTRRYRNRAARRTFEAALAELKTGDVCIDCGANVGRVTSRMAATGARVHAFEPDPVAFAALQREVGFFPNVTLHNLAVGVGCARVKLYGGSHPGPQSRLWGGVTTVAGKSNIDGDEFVLVDQVDFVSFLHEIDAPIAIIKMDIEGAEIALLFDLLDKGLHARAKHIFVETHEKQFPRLRKAMMALQQRCRPYSNINLNWW